MKKAGIDLALSQKDCVLLFADEVAGEEGTKIVESIGEGATDDKIEKATSFKIADIRSKLNVLHNYGIVEYTREKNLQTGWFTYTWFVNSERALQNLLRKKKREYDGLRAQMHDGESAMLYSCAKKCVVIGVEHAMETKFKCPECNNKLKFVETNNAKELEMKITAIETLLNSGLRDKRI
ncbi:MAG: hypothetical protein V1834_04425 [Candidatus Micrarchaeota archaeon]